MVKLQRESTKGEPSADRVFPLWHGKVATIGFTRRVRVVNRFRFGMVKLQLKVLDAPPVDVDSFRFGMVKLQRETDSRSYETHAHVSALAW